MAVTTGELVPIAEDLNPDAEFRKKYGIPPKGAGPFAPSDYGFPLPPASDPDAKKYAQAILSRAHQNGDHDPELVAKQVAKARRILGETPPPAKESARKPIRGFFDLREINKGDAGEARVILIRAGHGNLGDRHYYPEKTLADSVAAGLWEGAQCYRDHPTPTEDREIPGRSVDRLAGWFSDARLVDYVDPEIGNCKAIEATFHPQSGDELTIGQLRTCAEYAKKNPTKSYLGLSINAAGDGKSGTVDGEDWNIVEKISEVVSVDLVTRAGAGGKPIAFRESYKMAATRITIDPAKLKEIAAADTLGALRRVLKEAAITLTPEQDQALDAELGLVDGGLLDRALDAATDITPDDDEDEPTDGDAMTDDEKAAALKAKEAEDDAAMEAELKGKSPDELLKLATASKKEAAAAAARETSLKEAAATAQTDAETAKAELAKRESDLAELKKGNERLTEADREMKTMRVERVLEAQNVPERYRPLLTRELMERASLTTEPQIAGFAADWAKAHIASDDSSGATIREGAGGGTPAKMDLTFPTPTAYA